MSKSDLVKLVKRIMECEGSENEQDDLIELLEKNVEDPEISDYIFWPDKEMTPEEIVDKALTYRPIILQHKK